MLITYATIALLTFLIGSGLVGVMLVRLGGRWRLAGVLLLIEAILGIAAQVALSTIPFGIGEPLIRVPFRLVLLQTIGVTGAIGGINALLFLGSRYLKRRLNQPSVPILVAILLGMPLLASSSLYGLSRWSLPARERERNPLKREITLPPGFSWSVYAQGSIDNPTAIAFGPDNKLYIADISGALWVATDIDQDGTAETIQQWADGFQLLVGLVWRSEELYTASSGKIEALRDSDGDGKADQWRTVVDGLPSMVLMPHSNNGMAFGPDGRLYFGVGSTTNGQIETDEHAATVLSVNPDGSDLRVFARGLGNSFDVAFNQAGDLFAGDNSPIGSAAGEDYPDEFNHIVEGGHYGFPYFFGDPPTNGGTRGAIATFPPHSVPTGVTFYAGSEYPPEYKDSAFITLWARGEVAHVEVGETSSGAYLSRTTTFGSGFLYPIDAITGPDGSLYIADFGTSAIYRITYDPNKDLGQRE